MPHPGANHLAGVVNKKMQTLFKSKELLGTPYLLEEGMQKNFRISLVLCEKKKEVFVIYASYPYL